MADPLRISARIDIDPSKAQQGAAEGAKAVTSIGTAADQAAEQLEKLNRAAGEGLRMPLGGTGAELDRLRAKYNPLYAVIMNYKQAQLEIRSAHANGALSADEMTAALDRNRRSTLASIDAIKGRNKAISDTPANNNNQRFQTANLAYQAQDIVTTAAFMPWQTVMFQQGPQVAGIMGSMENKALGLRDALLSLVSPWSLISMAAVGATAFAIQYFTSAEEGAKSADEILKGHAETVRSLKERYGEAASGLREYVNEGVSGTLVDIRDRLQDARDFVTEAVTARSTYSPMITPFVKETDTAVVRQWRQAFIDLRESIRSGEPDILRFRDAMARIAGNNDVPEGLRELAKDMREFKDEAVVETARAIPGMVQQIELIGGKAQNQVAAVQDLNKALRELAGIAMPALSDADNALASYRRAVASAQGAEDRASARAAYDAALTRISNQNPTVINSDGNQTNVPLPGTKPITLGDRDRAAERAASSTANAYRDLIKTADDRVAQMKLEAELAGQTGVAADALRFKLDLLQQSEEKGRSLSSKQVEAINSRVDAFKKYAEAAASAKLKADLLFEREQLGRSAIDQQIAGGLRSSGLPVDFNSYEAGLLRTNLQLQYARDLAGDFTSTFFDGLRQGESVWDAFGNAGVKALQRIADTLMNDVLNSLFSVSNASSGSGGGFFTSILGGITNLFGGGKGAFPSAPGGLYAKGATFLDGIHGYSNQVVNKPTMFAFAKGTGLMGEAGPEAIMPLTRDASGRLGVSADVSPLMSQAKGASATAAPSGGRPDFNLKLTIEVNGARGNQEIEQMVREGVESGVQAGIEQYNRGLPDRVAEINADPWVRG
ncbi:phage tail length tape measure family protein [Agrobacterium tumefaciens]|uniref:phage tail length tape measure family protein n=1 Tax=Agrobacterium tumefaciens TaxID=358 RepID=UPI00045AB010|nr:phage tail length tape measure family protein [Agrobacterium tumefaciens]CDN93475.1 Prophage tail length tape measure protein [Agrobacterium tumefaciens]